MATTPDNRPWAPHPIPPWIVKEFTRRQNDIGFEYPTNVTWGDNGTWQQYKGPMTPWVRVFSNGTGRVSDRSNYPEKSGFILQGGYGFDKSYGTTLNGSTLSNKNVLGYDAEGNEHTLDLLSDGNLVSFPNSVSNDKRTVQKFLPIPGITSIDAVVQKERIRKITINWKCYGYAQLEYMTPYFLSPKISAFVEFGWNHFNPTSLLDLRTTNLNNLRELFSNSGSLLYDKNIRESYGLYDVTMGIVSGFDFSSQDGITFDCKTEIMSKHANYSGVLINSKASVSSNTEKTAVQSTFSEYLEKRLTKIPNCILQSKNFMVPLDADEEKAQTEGTFISSNLEFYKFDDGKYTSNGKKRAEDRVFLGRRDQYKDGEIKRGSTKYDWDYSDQKDIWVTFGFLIELANVFFTKQIELIKASDTGSNSPNKNNYFLYEIDVDEVKVGSHPNLISCDGSTLLIPNSVAPKYNMGWQFPSTDVNDNDYQKQTGFGNPAIFSSQNAKTVTAKGIKDLSPIDKTLIKIFKTGKKATGIKPPLGEPGFFSSLGSLVGIGDLADVENNANKPTPPLSIMRDDLDGIINRFRYRTQGNKNEHTFAFPQMKDDTNDTKIKAGYWGYLKDLYINKNIIIECAKSSDTVENFYNTLLDKINTAAGKIWDLAVIEDVDKLKIIDKKFIQYNTLKIYQFDVGATNKFIKSINFTAQLSNVAANQVISSASTNKSVDGSPNGDATSNQTLNFPYGDRFYINVPTNPRKIDENLETIKQLQNSPENIGGNKGGSYIMSFKSYGPSVALPSRADAAAARGPRTTTPLNPNIPTPPSRASAAAAMGPRTTTPLNPNIPTPPSRASAMGPRTTSSNQSSEKESGWNIVNLVLPNESLLLALLNDMDFTNNSNIYGGQQPGFNVEMTLQGISGLRTFQLFSLKNLPSPYSEREIMCQIVDISHKIDAGNWTTTIKAGIRSIRGKTIIFTTDGINEYKINAIK